MRWVALLVLLAACDRGKSSPSQGSGLPAPQANLMRTVADGVFATPRGADAVLPDAAIALTLSIKGGLSTLGRLDWTAQDEQATAALIQQRIGLGDISVSYAVIREREGYWSVTRGDNEIIQVLRGLDGAPEGARPATVIVWTPEVPTTDGIKVGDTVGMLLARVPNLVCKSDDERMIRQTVAAKVLCRGYDGALAYIVNPQKQRLKRGEVKPASLQDHDIVAIVHEFEY